MMKPTILTILVIFASVCYSQQAATKDFLMGRVLNKLQKTTLDKFNEMKSKAAEKEVSLNRVSGLRNFEAQKGIWEAKWCGKRYIDDLSKTYFANTDEGRCNDVPLSARKPILRIARNLVTNLTNIEKAKKILKYSSMPGTSRHHWGTDIDINSTDPKYWEEEPGKTEYNWLKLHAWKFGFCQVYSEKSLRDNKGYEQEKWHWSYMPFAKPYLAEFKDKVTPEDVKNLNFLGSDVASSLMDEYISSINPDCNNL
jgi:zinc D-Ala-D-Ala carboxypeptidase